MVSSIAGVPPVPATRTDIYVSPDAGGAGDTCILTHRPSELDLLSVECFPLAQPIAPINSRDFEFDVPLPPRPPRGKIKWRVIPHPFPGGVAGKLRVSRRLKESPPHLHVRVRLTRRVHGEFPTGFAGTLLAGWLHDTTPLTHVRVTASALVIRNALQRATPVAPKGCSSNDDPCDTAADCPSGDSCLGAGPVKSWVMQAAVNGEWQEFSGLDVVNTSDVIPQSLVYNQWLPTNGAVHLEVVGSARECIDTMFAKSLATDLVELGFNKGLQCLASTSPDPGRINLTYPAPDFGAGSGSMDYETVSTGGAGGNCSMTTGLTCVVDADCPSGEMCNTTGGAFALRYRIERVAD
jgi:hypothetical protein